MQSIMGKFHYTTHVKLAEYIVVIKQNAVTCQYTCKYVSVWPAYDMTYNVNTDNICCIFDFRIRAALTATTNLPVDQRSI